MQSQKLTLLLYGLGFGLALLFDWFFIDKMAGWVVLFFIILLIASVLAVEYSVKKTFYPSFHYILLVPILMLSLSQALYEQPFFRFWNQIFLTSLLLLFFCSSIISWKTFLELNIVRSTVAFLQVIVSAFGKAPGIGQLPVDKQGYGKRILIGLAVALPLVIFLMLLLASADLVFSQYIHSLLSSLKLSFDIARFIQHSVVILFATIFFVALLTVIAVDGFREKLTTLLTPSTQNKTHDRLITSIVLTAVNALYIFFIAIQFVYLFGGERNITFSDFTYSSYTHRGFYELVMVAFINLVLVLFTYKGLGQVRTKGFTVVFSSQVLLVINTFFIIYSAYLRISLYLGSYGWTRLRFYVWIFIIGMGMLFLFLLIGLLLKQRVTVLSKGTLALLALTYCGCALLNVDAFIVQKNIERFTATGKLDTYYFNQLSLDAVPILMQIKETLPSSEKEEVEQALSTKKYTLEKRQPSEKEGIEQVLLTKKYALEKRPRQWQEYTLSYQNALSTLASFSGTTPSESNDGRDEQGEYYRD